MDGYITRCRFHEGLHSYAVSGMVLTRVCGISGVGFGGAGHAQSKAILYHQIAAEHRLYPGMVEEGVLNVLDPTAFPCSGAREEANADLPCPACKKRNVQKKLGGGRVLCRCGRTYNPTAVPKKMPRCPDFKKVLKRGLKHAVVANGRKYNRYYCNGCKTSFGNV